MNREMDRDMNTAADTEVATDEVVLTIERPLDAPRQRVWEAFTHPSMFSQWWGPDGTTNLDVGIDATPGGRYAYRMHLPPTPGRGDVIVGVSGEFTEVDAERTLAYTYQWEGQDRITQVTVAMADRPGGGTDLTVRHEGLPMTEFADYETGWNASLDRLDAVTSMASPPMPPTPREDAGHDVTA